MWSTVQPVGRQRISAQRIKWRRQYEVPSRHRRRDPKFGVRTALAPIGAAAAIFCLASAWGPAGAAPELGTAAPTLVLTALNGATFDLAKLRGKVVLVNYWATWCAPCRKEMPKLDAFYRRYHARGLEMIGISIDFPRDFQKMRTAAAALSYPTAASKDISNDGFGPPAGVPITWIIDTEGKVRDRMIDVRDELLNGLVVPLLPHISPVGASAVDTH